MLLKTEGCAASPVMSFSSPLMSSITILWPWYAKPMPSCRDKQLHVNYGQRMQPFICDGIAGVWPVRPIQHLTGISPRSCGGFGSSENVEEAEGLTMYVPL